MDAMRLFLRVADAGSFSRAAQDLGIGQPTVSRRIQDLEHRIGAELFLRTTRARSLTEAGERFRERATRILSEFDEAEAEARGLDQEPVGLLRLTAPHSLCRRIIAPQLAKFLALYPHIRIDLVEDDRVVDLVEEGVDIAFRFGALPDSSLMAKKLGETRRRAWASPTRAIMHELS
jgi:DNA-binding transcriptional LysR family regulator